MRGTVLAASLALLVGGSSVGCKTTSNMAWWKSAGKDAPEANVLAHSAPELPSEIAKQVEAASAGASQQLAGGVAAPFVPSAATPPAATVASLANAAAYPSTEAPKFTPATPATTVPAAPASANLGSVAMPYNPNAVPPVAKAAPAAAPVSTDRYAAATAPASTTTPAATSYPGSSTRYGAQVASVPTAPTTSTPATSPYAAAAPSTPTSAASIEPQLSSRYAQTVPSTSLPVDNSLATPQAPAVPASATPVSVAEAAPFRPGGTGTYPATTDLRSPVQVATRPDAPAAEETPTPEAASVYGGSQPATPVVPQVPRYR